MPGPFLFLIYSLSLESHLLLSLVSLQKEEGRGSNSASLVSEN